LSWLSSIIRQNRFFGRQSPKCRPIPMKFGRVLLWHRTHSRVQFDPDRWMGGSRPKENDCVFVVPKMYHNSSYIAYNGSPRSRWWQTHKCVVSGLCCRETFRKFLTGQSKKRRNFRYRLHSLQKKVFLQTNGTDGKVYSQGVPFWVSTTHHISSTQNGNWKLRNFEPRNSFRPSYPSST